MGESILKKLKSFIKLLKPSKRKFVVFFPVIIFEIFFLFTLILYRNGPWIFPYRKDNELLIFLLLCDLAFAIGYIMIIIFNRKSKIVVRT
jgi:hypothetical protein